MEECHCLCVAATLLEQSLFLLANCRCCVGSFIFVTRGVWVSLFIVMLSRGYDLGHNVSSYGGVIVKVQLFMHVCKCIVLDTDRIMTFYIKCK